MGVYTGSGASFPKLIHSLDSEDGDLVGPGAYTLTGATIEATNARFGLNLRADAVGERLDGDSDVTGFDDTDGKKVIYHCFWQTPNLTGVKTLGGITNSSFGINRTRINFFGGRIRLDWTRQTDLGGPGTPHLRILSNAGKIVIDTSHTLVGYIDSGSVSQGKVFIDGVDETFSITNDGIFGALAGNHKSIRLGNHVNALDPAQFVDEFTILQADSFTDAIVSALVAKYSETRYFGFHQTLDSLSSFSGAPGTPITALGRGYGLDVVFKINEVPVDNQVRVNEGKVTFNVPDIAPGVFDLSIKNVLANVTFTEPAFFTVNPSPLKVLTATATGRRTIEVDFDRDVKQVDPANADDALNPANYSFRPVNTPEFTAVFTPTVLSVTIVDTDTVELLVDDDFSYARDYELEALNVESTEGGQLDPSSRTDEFISVDPRPINRPREN